MQKLILSLLLAACTLIFLDSCQVQEPELMDCEVSFKKDLLPIINTSCAGNYCHPSLSPDFTSFFADYENIKSVADEGKLYEEVVEFKTMPKGGGTELPEVFLTEYRDLFACWIEAGANNN